MNISEIEEDEELLLEFQVFDGRDLMNVISYTVMSLSKQKYCKNAKNYFVNISWNDVQYLGIDNSWETSKQTRCEVGSQIYERSSLPLFSHKNKRFFLAKVCCFL